MAKVLGPEKYARLPTTAAVEVESPPKLSVGVLPPEETIGHEPDTLVTAEVKKPESLVSWLVASFCQAAAEPLVMKTVEEAPTAVRPVPPLAIASAVPDQLLLLTVLRVANAPRPDTCVDGNDKLLKVVMDATELVAAKSVMKRASARVLKEVV